MGKVKADSVNSVEVTEGHRTIELTNQNEIDRAGDEENRKKFTQTNQTPCMQQPLRHLLGETGLTEFSNKIIDGTAVLPLTTPEYTKEFFAQLKKDDNIQLDTVKAHYTTREYIDGWKKINEQISSGKSGRHYGHMKTCAEDKLLADFKSSIMNIPYTSGYSPKPWQEGNIVMIKKRINSNNISSLRTIVLMEADFNYNNKLLGEKTMYHAEQTKPLAPEQYGSRKGKSAIDQTIHKALTYDIIRQHCLPAMLCSNDAKSCYDRILHSIASIAYRRLGVESPPVQCMLESIQNMKFHIQTSHGLSTIMLSNKNTLIPFQGILQGNGAAPTTWVIISTPLLNMLRAAQNGGFFLSPVTKEMTHLVGFAFVDDMDILLLNMRDKDITFDEIADNMQDAIDCWEGGLKTTGGAIVPGKSWVYAMDFEFDDKGLPEMKSINEIDQEFSVLDHNNVRQPLSLIATNVGKETLGVYLDLEGTHSEAVKQMRKKACEWRDNIKVGHISWSNAWLATQTTIMKSLEYPLPALSLSVQQCTKILHPALQGSLAKISINRTIPKAIRHGPIDEGGLNIHNLYTSQGIFKLQKFHQHIREDSITGRLLQVSLETCILEAGVGRNLFALNYARFSPLVTNCWIKHLWEFTTNNSIHIVNRSSNFPPNPVGQ